MTPQGRKIAETAWVITIYMIMKIGIQMLNQFNKLVFRQINRQKSSIDNTVKRNFV